MAHPNFCPADLSVCSASFGKGQIYHCKVCVAHTHGLWERDGSDSGRVLDSTEGLRVRASPASLPCVLEQGHINPSLVLVQPRKTRPYITQGLLMGCKELNQTNKQTNIPMVCCHWSCLEH